jgi:hypothetical protein
LNLSLLILYGRVAIRFLGALYTTTNAIFITDADNFFPDFKSLYDNMGDNSSIRNANANVGSSSTSYVSLFIFIEFVLHNFLY